jgi:Ser/Thr protein kinase RdoA (MazF antagonist)
VTSEPDSDGLLSLVCQTLLDSSPDRLWFAAGQVNRVYGLRLHDGRDVVIKLHLTAMPLTRLRATHRAQMRLADANFPCPRPIIAPARLPGHGTVTVEEMVTAGGPGRPHTDAHRRAMVEAFCWHHDLLRDQRVTAALRRPPAWADVRPRVHLWPRPHVPALRFRAERQARWIDNLARTAYAELSGFSDSITIAHCDWESQNMRFEDDRVRVVWDWDSLLAERTACLVGFAAACHTAQGEAGIPDAPKPAEVARFLDSYADISGRRWTKPRRSAAAAAALWLIAYNARIEQASTPAEPSWLLALDYWDGQYLDL